MNTFRLRVIFIAWLALALALTGGFGLRASAAPQAAHTVLPVTIDASFGVNGVASLPTYFCVSGCNILPEPNGSLRLAGVGVNQGKATLSLAHILQNGDLDSSFGVNGVMTATIANLVSAFKTIPQADGAWLVMGMAVTNITLGDFGLARYLPDGSLDTGFGSAGVVNANLRAGSKSPQVLAVQPDKKILMAGVVVNEIATLRFLPDGRRDPDFADNGLKQLMLSSEQQQNVLDIAVQADKKILICGDFVNSSNLARSFFLRLNEDGSVDNTFGINGSITYEKPSNNYAIGKVIPLPDGRFLGLGAFSNPNLTASTPVIARFLDDGSKDPSFCDSCLQPGNMMRYQDAVFQPGDELVVFGDGMTDTSLVRYLPDGSALDGFFGSGGVISVTNSFPTIPLVRDMQGRLVFGVFSFAPEATGSNLIRYLPERYHVYLPQLQR